MKLATYMAEIERAYQTFYMTRRYLPQHQHTLLIINHAVLPISYPENVNTRVHRNLHLILIPQIIQFHSLRKKN
jgi:hypothetical protein